MNRRFALRVTMTALLLAGGCSQVSTPTGPSTSTVGVTDDASPEESTLGTDADASATASAAGVTALATATSPSLTIDVSYPAVIVGTTSTTYLTVASPTYASMYCAQVTMTTTGGFSVSSGGSYPGTIASGSVRRIPFSMRAPSSAASGSLTARLTWSGSPSCGGTQMTRLAYATVRAAAPWKVAVSLSATGVVTSDPAALAIISSPDSWRYKTGTNVNSPYVSTMLLPPSPGSYRFSGTWKYYFMGAPMTRSKTVYATVTGSGQAVTIR